MDVKKALAIGACAATFGNLAGCMVVPAGGYDNGPVYPTYRYAPPPVVVPPPVIVVPRLYPFGWRNYHHGYWPHY